MPRLTHGQLYDAILFYSYQANTGQ